ncbi:MAG: hypothetical protein K6F33_06960 [Bacteroidales bacterium]|nr:hypothetical protein [Bacteroidales bacterium]
MKIFFITMFAVLATTATLSAQQCINLDELRLHAQNIKMDGDMRLDSANGIVLERTIAYPDKIQDELYAVVSYWVETNYGNLPDTTIAITNLTHSNIKAKGHIGWRLDKRGRHGIDIRPNISIEIADGLITIKQYISQYEVWSGKESSIKIGGFYRHKTYKSTTCISVYHLYNDKFPILKELFITETQNEIPFNESLRMSIAYEEKIFNEIKSAFDN